MACSAASRVSKTMTDMPTPSTGLSQYALTKPGALGTILSLRSESAARATLTSSMRTVATTACMGLSVAVPGRPVNGITPRWRAGGRSLTAEGSGSRQQAASGQRGGRQRYRLLRALAEQREVELAGDRRGAERAEERAVPLRVDERPAGRGQALPHVGDGDRGRARVPTEQRVPA